MKCVILSTVFHTFNQIFPPFLSNFDNFATTVTCKTFFLIRDINKCYHRKLKLGYSTHVQHIWNFTKILEQLFP